MGYLTDFEFQIYDGKPGEDDISLNYKPLQEFAKMYGYEQMFDHPFDRSYGHGHGFNLEKNLTEFSKIYPNLLFVVTGDGEDPDDFWKAYIKDGRIQICRGYIAYEDFDPMKLIRPETAEVEIQPEEYET